MTMPIRFAAWGIVPGKNRNTFWDEWSNFYEQAEQAGTLNIKTLDAEFQEHLRTTYHLPPDKNLHTSLRAIMGSLVWATNREASVLRLLDDTPQFCSKPQDSFEKADKIVKNQRVKTDMIHYTAFAKTWLMAIQVLKNMAFLSAPLKPDLSPDSEGIKLLNEGLKANQNELHQLIDGLIAGEFDKPLAPGICRV